ncbi:MAG: hypothetical protein C0467_17590 [Planctomycetaceae bacterium]|nr:hypothetical protein [Planctomycetaceae bacterium]
MNSFTSLKQLDKVSARLTRELKALPIFMGGVPTGNGPVADGRLLLTPGAWLVAVNVTVHFEVADFLELQVVLAGDARFRGPRAVVPNEVGALALADLVQDRHKLDWNEDATRTASFCGVVPVPESPDPVTCELWGSADAKHGIDVEFTGGELLAVQLGGAK